MDAISLIMFVVPLLVAIIFTMLCLSSLKKPDWLTFFSSLLSSVAWFIFGLTWPAVATSEMFVTVGYLWYGIGIIFAAITLYVGMRLLLAIFEVKVPTLVLKQGSGEE